MALTLTASAAKTVIYHSEDRPDDQGQHVGHTIRQHINISRLGLMNRMDAGPSRRDRKEVFWRSAFLSVDSAAEVLSQAIGVLAAHPFVANFENHADGEELTADSDVSMFWCRDQRGRFPASQVHIYARKMAARPYGIHLVTMYPILTI